MTNRPDIDSMHDLAGKTLPLSLLSSDDEQRAGIRVTRSEFAKMMGCSRQAVTDWVQSGRIAVGADGRFDPRQAVTSLLRTGDPSRIRAKVLEPLTRELGAMTNRIATMDEQLAEATAKIAKLAEELHDEREAGDFQEEVIGELLEKLEKLKKMISDEWSMLIEVPDSMGQAVLLDCLALDSSETSFAEAAPRLLGKGGEGETELTAIDFSEEIARDADQVNL